MTEEIAKEKIQKLKKQAEQELFGEGLDIDLSEIIKPQDLTGVELVSKHKHKVPVIDKINLKLDQDKTELIGKVVEYSSESEPEPESDPEIDRFSMIEFKCKICGRTFVKKAQAFIAMPDCPFCRK